MRRHSRAPVALEAPVGPAQVLVVPAVAPAELARAAAHVRAGPARALVELVAEPAAGLVEPAERDKAGARDLVAHGIMQNEDVSGQSFLIRDNHGETVVTVPFRDTLPGRLKG
jgi:hypothetical protein